MQSMQTSSGWEALFVQIIDLFIYVFVFSVSQLRSLLQKQSKDGNVASSSPSKRKLTGTVTLLQLNQGFPK